MNSHIKIFASPELLAESFAEYFASEVRLKDNYNIALSGGSTPEVIFKTLADNFSVKIDWTKVHFFWGDERCVPPDSNESNYKMAKETLLDKISIPSSNIHRIRGESEPTEVALRYSNEILNNIPIVNDLPCFDFVMLGLGEDGHTASIFPDRLDLFNTDKICEAVQHPDTHQKRITLTGRVINNSSAAAFFVTGNSKSIVVEKVCKHPSINKNFPASNVNLVNGNLFWYLDSKSASKL